ncbi:MAG TPA: amidohydrolase family protein [Clostridiales bacterium]|nr:amidohydrolase family protein [Clostridiales bacterium]
MALFTVNQVDKAFYRERLQDFLPEKILDVHTHVYLPDPDEYNSGRTVSWPSLVANANPIDDLDETARLMFPGKTYVPLMFGMPSEGGDMAKGNAYVSACSASRGYPALMLVRPDMTAAEVESGILEGGFSGIKVYLNLAPQYIPVNEIRIFDFLPHSHLEVCDRHGLTVMLHIPRPKRLRDPLNIAQLLEIENTYKNLHLIVAHVGRAYTQKDVGDAFEQLKDTRNMIFDFSANTNAWVFEQLIRAVGSSRIVFGSDLPITRMRMRRIERNGIYVNLVPRGLYGDVSDDPNMDELDPPESDQLTFFLYEEIEAMRQAALKTGLGQSDIERIFWSNAAHIFGLK